MKTTNTNDQRLWIYAILAFGLLECVILTLILIEPAPANATGISHPSIPSMIIGASSDRFAPVANYAWWLNIFFLAQAHCLAALGVNAARRDTSFLIFLGICYAVAMIVWWQIFEGYRLYVETGQTEFVFGFPTSTAWQTYGLWFSGCALVALYSFGFNRYIWSDADQQTFDELVAKHTSTTGEGA